MTETAVTENAVTETAGRWNDGPSAGQQPAAATLLSGRQKAAVIVRLLLGEGVALSLDRLPAEMQSDLTEEMGRMQYIDRATLQAVVREFLGEMDELGLSFPGDIGGALGLLDGHISPETAERLRAGAGLDAAPADPWARLADAAPDDLLALLEAEAPEIGAVMLSKLEVGAAAALLGRLPGPDARRLSHAVSVTGEVAPATVARIGAALVEQLSQRPERAFDTAPGERVGAILNSASASIRDGVLAGLADDDAAFAEEVRRAIFTFENIPGRLAARDVPALVRALDQAVLVTALCAASGGEGGPAAAAAHLLDNMSQRMADQLRDEIEERDPVDPAEAEAAMAAVVAELRRMAGKGEIKLIRPAEP